MSYEAAIFRPAFKFKGSFDRVIRFSIQGSSGHYCSPRMNLIELLEYQTLEFAISFGDGDFVKPSAVGFPEFDEHVDNDGIGAYVPTETVMELLSLMTAKYGQPVIERD